MKEQVDPALFYLGNRLLIHKVNEFISPKIWQYILIIGLEWGGIMNMNEHNSMPYMQCLSSCLNRIMREGYTESFKITDQRLESFNNHHNYKPEEVKVVTFFRFEGESDPGDNAILYVIETNDGTKGTLVDSYGAYNDQQVSRFMEDIPIQKRVNRN